MATSLFTHLNQQELNRANSLSFFADEDRLARKPRCSDSKDYSVIRTAAHALTHPYIQPNSPVAFARLVFDLDWHDAKNRYHKLPLRFLADRHAWVDFVGLPAPNWAALSLDKNSAHIGYELVTPVGRHANARINPQRYLAAIEVAMTKMLDADKGFNGLLCKNPLNARWGFYKGLSQPWHLQELAEYVELEDAEPNDFTRTPRGEVGRNVYLFDRCRFWAYDNVRHYRSGRYEAWEQSVLNTAQRINAASYDHLTALAGRGLLPLSECRAVAKSVARWAWANHGERKNTAAFSELQSWRGSRGATAAAKGKRERREQQIISAIAQLTAQGQTPTMGKVANLIGCSKGTLSMHYKSFFQGPLQ